MQPLPGFRDFLPDDCAARNYIFARWRDVARRYGFVEWDGPLLEPTNLYKKKSGDEIVGQLFNFIDKGEREVALRPELTPTLARVIAAHEREFKKPLKWFSIGQFFRYEKQQRGRLREHFQLNCDIIGESSFSADVELIALCIDILRAFGLTAKDFVVRISDREFWTDFLQQHDGIIHGVLERHGCIILRHGRPAMPRHIDDVRDPAISNEIFGPTLTAIGCADKTRSRGAAAVNQDDRSLVRWLRGDERFDVHRIGCGSGKEIIFSEGHRLRTRRISCDSRYHGEEKYDSIEFHVGLFQFEKIN